MSIIVHGLSLPPTCAACPMCHSDDFFRVFAECKGDLNPIEVTWDKGRPEWCPMEEYNEDGKQTDKHR